MSRPSFLDSIKSYWPIIIVVASLIVGWTTMGATLEENTNRITAVEVKVENIDETYLQIQKDLVEIRTSLKFIEQKIK